MYEKRVSIIVLFLLCLLVPYAFIFYNDFKDIYSLENTWLKVDAKFRYEEYDSDGEGTHFVYTHALDKYGDKEIKLESDWGSDTEVFYINPKDYEDYFADYELLFVWINAIGGGFITLMLCAWFAIKYN